MPRYTVYALYTASKFLGEYEADTPEEAVAKAEEAGDYHVSLCWQCSREIDLGDAYETKAEPA